ncbi:phage replication protein [Bacillus sp. OxB-1]|uniref:ATP-binding protein n=1 Tax=Bacillus sp. (strain OxB-1) TaxID=98228 RepID=UPI000582251F|nr:ATP-binding protein [Bacillus sp. OxB-1]BAQ11343.1 phage replication protein [Bacillus sp. OxB-1]
MKGIQDILENLPKPVVLSSYDCEGCGEKVSVTEMAIAGGPEKGKLERFFLGCKCEDQLIAEMVVANERKAKMNRAKDVFDQNSLVNQSLLKATFVNYIAPSPELEKAKNEVLGFVSSFDAVEGKNLLLTGSYGTGKSHLSFSAAKALIELGYSALFLSVPKLLTKIKDTYNSKAQFSENDLLDYIANVDMLVLDDLGAEYTNLRNDGDNWTWTKLFEVIDSRSGRSTIYTTNLSAAELEAKVNPRNFSRMMENTEVVKMNGRDYRKKDF